jgi:preprotein translocase subunit YajC
MPQQPAFIMQFIPVVLIFGIFYFGVIRPEQKKQKDHQELVKNLRKNDEVITSGGIHGVVVNIKDTTIVLRVDDNVRIEFEKDVVLVLKKKAE